MALIDDDPKPAYIKTLKTDDNTYPTDIYSLDGRRISHHQPGLNIIRMNDGSSKKIIKK